MRTNNFTYNLQKRETKTKGTVYDVYFYVTDLDGKQVQKKLSGFKTKAEATRAYSAFMERSLSAPKVDRNAKYLMYEDARQVYLQTIAVRLKESSIYDFKHIAAKYHDVFFKRKNLHTMTKQDIIAYQEWLWRQKKADGSLISHVYASSVYGQFRAFYRWCVERYDVPNVLTSPPKIKTERREYVVWSQNDFNDFISVVDTDKYKTLFTVLFYCGLRVGEAQALKVKDYDGTALLVHSTYTKKTTDGSTYKLTETKNRKTRRVPLPVPCKVVLNKWLKGRKKDEFIFGNGSPLSLNAIQWALDSNIKKSGVPDIRIHDLRHSYASMLISKGANFAVVASLLGDTIDMVIKTYAHSLEEDKIAVINSII